MCACVCRASVRPRVCLFILLFSRARARVCVVCCVRESSATVAVLTIALQSSHRVFTVHSTLHRCMISMCCACTLRRLHRAQTHTHTQSCTRLSVSLVHSVPMRWQMKPFGSDDGDGDDGDLLCTYVICALP